MLDVEVRYFIQEICKRILRAFRAWVLDLKVSSGTLFKNYISAFFVLVVRGC